MSLVREYGHSAQHSLTKPAEPPIKSDPPSSQIPLETEEVYERTIKASLNGWDFAQLEKDAQEARASKGRLLGGAWKLYMFYDAVSLPAGGKQATDADWMNHLQTLNQWKLAQPDSATVRIAIAQADVSFAWKARGHGYSDSVSGDGWNLYNDRNALAAAALADAARQKTKCPYWYEVMQQIALGQGWSKTDARELFEQAAAFEPGYYHFYREYANFLLPKWYGEEGETQAFAGEVSDRIGGREGDFLYFELASIVICNCEHKDEPNPAMSWPRIQRGYVALAQLYGISDLKMNRFAMMAYVVGDKPVAQQTFAKIGDDWVKDVWWNKDDFDGAKAWAAAP